jgi:hypothetical protein
MRTYARQRLQGEQMRALCCFNQLSHYDNAFGALKAVDYSGSSRCEKGVSRCWHVLSSNARKIDLDVMITFALRITTRLD